MSSCMHPHHQKVLEKFNLDSPGAVAEEGRQVPWATIPLGNGNINGTFLVTSPSGDAAYVLQEINHFVFKDIDGLMNNMICVTEHLKRLGVRTLELVSLRSESSTSQYYFQSPTDQTFWRVFKYIPKCKSVLDQSLLTYQDVAKAAKAFGDFQYQLRTLPVANLKETIPNFHNTRFRYKSFLESVRCDSFGLLKVEGVQADVDFVLSREEKYVDLLLDLKDKVTGDRVPLRVVHNDTKISNVLISEVTGDAVCVIDLDTVMPGRSLYDFADIVRSSCSSCGEEESDLSRVHMRLDMFRAAAEGYLASEMCMGSETNERLWPVEIEHLCVAGQVITYEQGLRFLSDYLQGDVYYKLPPGAPDNFNLVRARNQFALLASMEEQAEAMKNTVDSILSSLQLLPHNVKSECGSS